MKTSEEESLSPEIEELLEEFQDVFRVPQGLPRPRQCDHHIPLQNPQLAVKVRPYRSPFIIKMKLRDKCKKF